MLNNISSLLISVNTSPALSKESKQKLMQCINILKEVPLMQEILSHIPYGLKFQLKQDTSTESFFDESTQTICFDYFYFTNTPPTELALTLAQELCYANQYNQGISFSKNKLFFEETTLVAKLMEVEAHLNTAQIAHQLSIQNPLGTVYNQLLKTRSPQKARTDMACLLWNGIIPEELKELTPVIEEQTFFDNLRAYRRAYQVYGPVDKPIIQKGSARLKNICQTYINRLKLDLKPEWFSGEENSNTIVCPHLYLTKDLKTDQITSFAMAHPFKTDEITILEVEPLTAETVDWHIAVQIEGTTYYPVRTLIYENETFICEDEEMTNNLPFALFINQINLTDFTQKQSQIAKQQEETATGFYLLFAVISGNLAACKQILEKHPKAINFCDFSDTTPIEQALMSVHEEKDEMISYLLTKNPDLLRVDKDGQKILDLLPQVQNPQTKQQIVSLYGKQLQTQMPIAKQRIFPNAEKGERSR